MKYKIVLAVGTRPEVIKVAPLYLTLKNQSWCEPILFTTGQHRDLLAQTLAVFNLKSDVSLDVMTENQTLAELTAKVLQGSTQVINQVDPQAILVQGDTTTAMSVGLAAFYQQRSCLHLEAGLRSGNLTNPFPEELNRRLIGQMSRLHFCATESARDNLLAEGFKADRVFVTGNTVIDALLNTVERAIPSLGPLKDIHPQSRVILVTTHRRESFGAPLRSTLSAIQKIVQEFRDVEIVLPVHPNPNVRRVISDELAGTPRVHLTEPLDYVSFVAAMKRSYFILSDSGGVQEEAPALGKPVLVLRDTTERPEVVELGMAKLIGTSASVIFSSAAELLSSEAAYKAMVKGYSPYGDGKSSERIAQLIRTFSHQT